MLREYPKHTSFFTKKPQNTTKTFQIITKDLNRPKVVFLVVIRKTSTTNFSTTKRKVSTNFISPLN